MFFIGFKGEMDEFLPAPRRKLEFTASFNS